MGLLIKVIQASGFQTTERYGERWQDMEIAPLVDAAMREDSSSVFLQLGYLEGRIARLKQLLEEAGIEVPENEARRFIETL